MPTNIDSLPGGASAPAQASPVNPLVPQAANVATPSALTAVAPAAITSLAAPAGGTGATAGAYDTAVNRDAMITSHNAIRTDVAAIRAEVVKLVTDLTALRVSVAAEIAALKTATLQASA